MKKIMTLTFIFTISIFGAFSVEDFAKSKNLSPAETKMAICLNDNYFTPAQAVKYATFSPFSVRYTKDLYLSEDMIMSHKMCYDLMVKTNQYKKEQEIVKKEQEKRRFEYAQYEEEKHKKRLDLLKEFLTNPAYKPTRNKLLIASEHYFRHHGNSHPYKGDILRISKNSKGETIVCVERKKKNIGCALDYEIYARQFEDFYISKKDIEDIRNNFFSISKKFTKTIGSKSRKIKSMY